MSLGLALGQGQTLAQALGGRTAVTEGVYTAVAVRRIAADKGIEMPICSAVCDIVEGRLSVADAIGQLMQRPLKHED
jgi:glycerol-3-phosphate dehydrogenase (NAD(P)+)